MFFEFVDGAFRGGRWAIPVRVILAQMLYQFIEGHARARLAQPHGKLALANSQHASSIHEILQGLGDGLHVHRAIQAAVAEELGRVPRIGTWLRRLLATLRSGW